MPAENLIETERLGIRPPTSQDAQMTAEFYSANREHLWNWEPARDHGFAEEAVAVLGKWKFNPATLKNGKPRQVPGFTYRQEG